ncbi:maleylpyruvate isomerase family mycothiol-dependent enzyme [Actinoplanes sp. KI2]|uniref:maleylpyruvate isomerase family mycothiol-dependent enzyme n=1 Tax=Actinoplanes sp. KI2 TaxID=2983315 RepID=UPI0021D5773C|nr:maleylpyruvate isomerase family mycothiol-dependent enzyme [Actinoplanes sp. KI2]MCU7727927.1 maleylpyruvate isomerase family mycothiol-dependent enzyme [Actinoplanes sp. KI2]
MDHPDDLLESFAFGETFGAAPAVGAHVDACPQCAAHVELARAAAGWLATSHVATPPSGLRSRVLTAAVGARPPSSGSVSSAYVAEVADLGVLLDSLSPAQWSAPTVDGRSVRDLVRHLTGNDGNVLADLGVPGPPGERWRQQSDLLLRTVGQGGDALLDRPVRLAGKVPVRRPLRDALTQRAFETWIHRDDIRIAVALPPIPPASDHLSRILGFGLAMLPAAIDAAGRARPGKVLLDLTGPGGAEHVVGMGTRATASDTGASNGAWLAEVRMPAERFGRLMAGRVPVTPSVAVVRGDRSAALDLLAVAATLGCE